MDRGGQRRHLETSQEAIAIVQVREGLVAARSRVVTGREQPDSERVLEKKLTGS